MSRRRKKDGELIDVLWAIFTHLPWWAGPPAIAFTYLLFAAILPAVLNGTVSAATDPAADVVNKSLSQIPGRASEMLAPVFTLGVTIIWLASLVQKLKGRTLLRRSVKIERIRDLSWERFEELVGEYYRQQGYWVERRGGPRPDGGVDLEVYKDGELVLVQCKHWKAWKVGVKQIRELRGVMAHEGAQCGVLVCSGDFTQEAQDYARQNNVELVDGNRLSEMIRLGQEVRFQGTNPGPGPVPQVSSPEPERAPACPKCGVPMIMRTAKQGINAGSRFWGCAQFPKCRGIRNI